MPVPPVPPPPAGSHQILAALTRALLAAAESERLDTRELCARAGLRREELEDPDRFVPVERHFALAEAITRELGFLNSGLRWGAAIYGDPRSVLGYAVRRSGSHRRALERYCQYIAITNEGVRLACAPMDGGICLSAELVPGLWELGHPSEAPLAAWVSIARVATGKRWAPLRVEFRHSPRGPVDEHEAFFDCPVVFGAEVTCMLIGDAALDLPIVALPHPFDRVIAELEQRWLADVQPARRAEVMGLCAALAAGPLDPGAFALSLRMAAATLLRSGASPAAAFEIAYLLGFDDVRQVPARS